MKKFIIATTSIISLASVVTLQAEASTTLTIKPVLKEESGNQITFGVDVTNSQGHVMMYIQEGDYTNDTSLYPSGTVHGLLSPALTFTIEDGKEYTIKAEDMYGNSGYLLVNKQVVTAVDGDENTNLSVSVESGVLELTHGTVPNFNKVKLTDVGSTVSVNIPNLKVSDYRGTGEGWKLTASASTFTLDGGSHTLPAGSLILGGYSISGSDASLPDSSQTKVLDGSTVLLSSATEGKGLGTTEYQFENNNALNLYVNSITAKPGNYSSVLTINLTSGPN